MAPGSGKQKRRARTKIFEPIRYLDKGYDSSVVISSGRGYLKITLPVFLYQSRYDRLLDEARINEFIAQQKYPDLYKTDSLFEDTEENYTIKQMKRKFLIGKFISDPDQFYLDWVRFDLKGHEAISNIGYLFRDYFRYYGYAWMGKKQDTGYSYDIEIGYGDISDFEVLTLFHQLRQRNRWWNFVKKPPDRFMRLEFPRNRIKEIVGELKNFTIHGDNFKIKCNGNISAEFMSEDE